MKTIYRYFAVSALFAVSACNLEIELVEEPALVEISAKMEYETETRTSISGLEGEMYYPLWSAEDEIAVYADGDADPSRFSLTSGEGTTEANFTGTRSGKDYIAVYPYDSAGSVSDSILSITLPQTQKYAEASFGQGAYPMIGTGTAKEGLSFKNLCSVMKISFTGTAAIKSVTLTANDENTFLSGQASVSLDYATSGNYLTMSEGGSTSVTLETKGLQISEEAPADAYIVIPAQTYKGGLTIEVDTYAGKITKTIDTDLVFARSEIRTINDFTLESDLPDSDPDTNVPANEIWYTTNNGEIIKLSEQNCFDAIVQSNTYENGKGVIRFDEDVKLIGSGAFSSADNMVTITLPEGLVSIEPEAFAIFSFESNLKEVTLPSTLSSLGYFAFLNHDKIEKFYGKNKFVTEDNLALVIDDYNSYGCNMVAFANGSGLESYKIPEGVAGIEDYTFINNKDLKELEIPSSLQVIYGYEAFYNSNRIERLSGYHVEDDNRSLVIDGKLLYVASYGLTEYKTPATVEVLADGVLADKPTLEKIEISDNVKSVDFGNLCRECNNLREVIISASLYSYGSNLFYASNNINKVYIRSPLPPSMNSIYYNEGTDFTIYVPADFIHSYEQSPYWEKYLDIIQPYDYSDISDFLPDFYFSTDYSQHGTAAVLQTAAEGNGIDVVIMGDGYSDRQIADGTYEKDMRFVYDKMFDEEPYRSFKDLFNVSYVNVVSMAEGYENGTTALGCYFGSGTFIGGDDAKCMEMAQKVVTDDRMDNTLIVVVLNSNVYAGTCWMYYPSNTDTDYGCGVSIAYFPKGEDEEMFAQLLDHEAMGHGFTKLADEYYYTQTFPASMAQGFRDESKYGWWRNVDITNDPSKIKWKHFLEDDRYKYDGLGIYEGAYTYDKGVWRPTEFSIMHYNTGGFNAPSREAIYYRIHKLAYGDSWEYDYEKFVEYDAVNRKTSESAYAAGFNYVERVYEPTTPPVVVNKSWKDVSSDSSDRQSRLRR